MVMDVVIATVIATLLYHQVHHRLPLYYCTSVPSPVTGLLGSAGVCPDLAPSCHVFFLGGAFCSGGQDPIGSCIAVRVFPRYRTPLVSGVACSTLALAYQAPYESKGLYSTPEPEPLATRCGLSWGRASRFGPKGGTERRLGDPTAARPVAKVAGCRLRR